MPTHKMQRLYQLCLENIVQNANFWLQVKQIQEKTGLLGSPFDSLPASLEQDLLDMYERIHGLPGRNNFWLERQEKWRLFITRRITRLSITEYTEKISLVHIAATCRNLKHLEVRDVQEALPYLKAVAPCLTTIVSLNIDTMAHVTSASLKYIRNHCPNLRVLGLKSCFLNDKAMGHLKHISTLAELDLRDTEVTAAGVSQVLKSNPQLRSLHHPEVVRALYKLHSTRTWLVRVEASLLTPSTAACYHLREIELELSRKDNPSMLAVVVSVCPEIERVRIEFDARASPYALVPLAALKCLTELDVQCVADTNRKPWDDHPTNSTVLECVTLFEGSILPILQSCGNRLLTLSLEGVSGVDMKAVECHCPHLVSLGLYYNTYARNSFRIPDNKASVKPFPSLRRLLFGSNSGNDDFSAAYLEWLLSNENLEELSLSGSPLFTDELFACAFTNSAAFPRLRRLELDYCNVTAEVITGFLYHCGRKSLRELSICGPFVREQASPALCYIICEKLDVQLEAYFYSFIKMKKRMVRYKQDLNFISSKSDIASPRHLRENCRHADRHQ
ncbi:F-box and leucine-rich repeat protein 13-like [Periplaneta americana]|uniref:F-box and leucine-rich repeat protein 13-like n=1 Tax=Periplaneta americana TaxID=6978 RepID=UPI0037E8673A